MTDVDVGGLFPPWPGWLIGIPVDNEPKVDCRLTVNILFDGSVLVKVVDALMTLVVVIYPSRPGSSSIDDVVGDESSCG